MKAAAYYRVSTKKQQERESIETQKTEMTPWYQANGYEVTEYIDNGISGEEIDKRPAFNELLSDLERRQYKALLVFQIDRLGRFRNRADRHRVMQIIEKNNILVDTLHDESFDPDNEDDMDDLEKLLTEARRENRRRAKKIIAGQKRARNRGYFASGGIPYGLHWNGKEKKWEVNEVEYNTLKEIVRLLRSGKGLLKTANILNTDLEKYPPRKAKKWQNATIWGLMANDFLFTGKLLQNTMDRNRNPKPEKEWITIDTGHKFFDEKEIREVRHKMSQRRKRRKWDAPVEDFLLQGLAHCGKCGARLSIQATRPDGTKVYRYYKCHNKDKGYCSFKYAHADKIDRGVWKEFISTLTDQKRLKLAIIDEEFIPQSEKRDLETLLKRTNQELKELGEKRSRLNDLFIDGELTRKEYGERKVKLEKAEENTMAERRRIKNSLNRPAEMMQVVKLAVTECAERLERIKLFEEFKRHAEDWKNLDDAARAVIRFSQPDHPYLKNQERVNEEIGKSIKMRKQFKPIAQDIEKSIFEQRRQILHQWISVGGKIKIWKDKIEIKGPIFPTVKRDDDNVLTSLVDYRPHLR